MVAQSITHDVERCSRYAPANVRANSAVNSGLVHRPRIDHDEHLVRGDCSETARGYRRRAPLHRQGCPRRRDGLGVRVASVTSICINRSIDRGFRSCDPVADAGTRKTTTAKLISRMGMRVPLSTNLKSGWLYGLLSVPIRWSWVQLSRRDNYLGALYFRDLYCGGSRELRAGHPACNRATKGQPITLSTCRPT
jgi:hypothetical protein